ncbi:hypothetical protein BO70DRAFT_356410 [Aspergillus heteromorphus CBS 117.55]|uniref:Uncharacterized protein n=1 Tax=Aspergillus heteromorphus CBS 117.55 TaxID=1448321 RepID=A0A317V0L6_9EURO|nr:uncharacterized protein BO70DRAFT_356410 [Aspergillus heteromorphus CBS 117.55]PWY67209.1 hypothetical protein BO70DRAFT_356410 [Aspergillus heteromorphus CBS 117.55]
MKTYLFGQSVLSFTHFRPIKLEHKQLFDQTWIGRPVSFNNPSSQWIITSKLREHNSQKLPEEFVENPGEEKVLRVLMHLAIQSPICGQGSEIAIHAERARQALDTLPTFTQQELDVYTLLTEKNCASTLRLVQMRKEKQSDSDMVPGGLDRLSSPREAAWPEVGALVLGAGPGQTGSNPPGFQGGVGGWRDCVSAGIKSSLGFSRLFWDEPSGQM